MSLESELHAAHKARQRRLGVGYRAAGFGYVRPVYAKPEPVVAEVVAPPPGPERMPEQLPPEWLVRLRRRSGGARLLDIKRAVADEWGVDVGWLDADSRLLEHVRPRQVAMYLVRELLRKSFTFIGSGFGDRDHTTVLHAYRAVEGRMVGDDGFRERVERVAAVLEGR